MPRKRLHQLRKELDLSIIIVNYRSYGHLWQCLNSLPQSYGNLKTEIIVVDNTEKAHRQTIEGIKLSVPLNIFKAPTNLGYAAGVNLGIKKSNGRFLAIINPDVTMIENCLVKIYEFMIERPKIGLIGPKLLTLDGNIHLSCRTFPGLFILFYKRMPFFRSLPILKRRVERHMMEKYNHQSPKKVDWVSGSFMVVRREALDKIGLMDERFFMYFEDVDWCRRFWEKDLEVWYYPQAKAIHQAQNLSTQFGFLGFFHKISWIHLASYFKYFIKYLGAKRPGDRSKDRI